MTPRIHKLWPSWAVLIGLVVVFAGERVFAGQDTLRPLLAAVAAALLGAATVIRFQEWGAASQKKKGTAAILGASTAVIVVALVLYALIPLVFGGDDSASERMRAVLWAIWPIVLVTGALPLLFVESAVSPVAYIDRYESAQVSRSATRGVSLALFLSVLFVGNFLALRHDQKLELSAGHSATADEQTKRVVRDLTDKVKVVLFFPRANDVAERVAQYFEPLTALNDNLEVERIDHALAFELAKEAEVTENGYVALYRGKSHDKVQVGTKYKSARAALRRFDNNFVKALIRVTTDEKTAYYYAGHSERPFRRPPPDDKRGALTKLRRQLEAWQYKLKPFSIADGSATALPKDGEVLFIMGPEEPFLKEEIEVLQKAIKRGVRLFIALEGERSGDPMTGLLAPLGLEFDKTLLSATSSFVPLTRTDADRSFIYSTEFSSHRAVTTMTRNSGLAAIFSRTGSLKRNDKTKLKGVKTQIVLTASPDAFADANNNLRRDPGEARTALGLAAAVTATSTVGDKKESRIFVLADVDVMNDQVVTLLKGNGYFLLDIMRWLEPRPVPFVANTGEKDVKIIHKGADDALVFYGTTLAVPVLILVAGLFATRRRRRS